MEDKQELQRWVIKYPTIMPKRFIEKAVRKLKKLDPAIIQNFETKMQELNEKSIKGVIWQQILEEV